MALVIKVAPGADVKINEALGDYFATRLGPAIQANARRTVPVGSKTYSDAEGSHPGLLKRSIIVQVRKNGAKSILQVGSPLKYAAYVELGTSRQAPQPYLRPALLQARGA